MGRLLSFVWLFCACAGAGPAMAQAPVNDAIACRSLSGEAAIAACGRAISSGKLRDRDLALIYNRRGLELQRGGDPDSALKDFDEALRLDPKFALALSNRATIFRIRGDFNTAVSNYSEAIRLNPKLVQAYNGRGLAFNDKEEHDSAIADFNEAIRLDPRLALAYANRAAAYRAKGDFDHAIADCDEAIRIDPKAAIAYVNRGLVWRGKGDLDRAMADFEAAIQANEKLAVAYRERGNLYGAMNKVDSAIADFSTALRLNPNSARAYVARGRAYVVKGDYQRAIADTDQAIRIFPNGAAAHNLRGFALKQIGEIDRAIPEFDETIRLAPNTASAYANRGDGYRRKGDFEHAIADLDAAIRLDARFTAAYASRGLANQAMGKLDVARADFAAALDQPPSRSITAKDALDTARAKLAELAVAAPQPGTGAKGVAGEKRVALVIGNATYRSVASLANARRDASAVAAALQGAGFQTVDVEADLPREKLVDTLRGFARLAEEADWALIYYAGHGIQMGGVNFLVPVDAVLQTDRDVQFEALPLDQVLATVEGAKKLRIVLLDACRDNPFLSQMRRTTATRSIGRGLARIEPQGGTLVGFAAKDGEVALDGDGNNSPFVTAFVKRVAIPGIEIGKLFRLIRDDVLAATGGKQEPFVYGSLPGEDFYFRPPE